VSAPCLRIAGYAAVFGRVDRAGDVFLTGAFRDAEAGGVPLLLAHRGAPVGVILTLGEDARGLRIIAEVTDAEARRLVRGGALPGLSVGFRALEAKAGARRVIARAMLAEVSLVAVPMQPLATISEVSHREDV